MDFNLFGGTGDSGTPTSTESALYPTLTSISDFSSTGFPTFISSSATDAASETSLRFSATSSLVATSLTRPQLSSTFSSFDLSSSTGTSSSSSSTSSTFRSSSSSTFSSSSSSTFSSSSSTTSSTSSSSSSSSTSSTISSSSSTISSSSSEPSSSSSASSISSAASASASSSSRALSSSRSRSSLASLTSMASLDSSSTFATSATSSPSTTASPSSSFSPHSTTFTLGDKTITSYVTAEPTASASPDSGKLSSSPKIIGGVVGSVGGIIVLGALAVLFVYLRRRNRKTTNPSPDFSENNSGDLNPFSEKFGFKMPFSSKRSSTTAGGALAGMDDIERQVDQRANSTAHTGEDSGDFAYRGVTNSNNLDSVFRTTATNSSGTNTAGAATRFNSISKPLGTTYEDQDGFEFSQPQPSQPGDSGFDRDPGFEPRLGSGAVGHSSNPPYPSGRSGVGHSRGPSEDFVHFNPADYHLGEETNDSTANSRFKEEI